MYDAGPLISWVCMNTVLILKYPRLRYVAECNKNLLALPSYFVERIIHTLFFPEHPVSNSLPNYRQNASSGPQSSAAAAYSSVPSHCAACSVRSVSSVLVAEATPHPAGIPSPRADANFTAWRRPVGSEVSTMGLRHDGRGVLLL